MGEFPLVTASTVLFLQLIFLDFTPLDQRTGEIDNISVLHWDNIWYKICSLLPLPQKDNDTKSIIPAFCQSDCVSLAMCIRKQREKHDFMCQSNVPWIHRYNRVSWKSLHAKHRCCFMITRNQSRKGLWEDRMYLPRHTSSKLSPSSRTHSLIFWPFFSNPLQLQTHKYNSLFIYPGFL